MQIMHNDEYPKDSKTLYAALGFTANLELVTAKQLAAAHERTSTELETEESSGCHSAWVIRKELVGVARDVLLKPHRRSLYDVCGDSAWDFVTSNPHVDLFLEASGLEAAAGGEEEEEDANPLVRTPQALQLQRFLSRVRSWAQVPVGLMLLQTFILEALLRGFIPSQYGASGGGEVRATYSTLPLVLLPSWATLCLVFLFLVVLLFKQRLRSTAGQLMLIVYHSIYLAIFAGIVYHVAFIPQSNADDTAAMGYIMGLGTQFFILAELVGLFLHPETLWSLLRPTGIRVKLLAVSLSCSTTQCQCPQRSAPTGGDSISAASPPSLLATATAPSKALVAVFTLHALARALWRLVFWILLLLALLPSDSSLHLDSIAVLVLPLCAGCISTWVEVFWWNLAQGAMEVKCSGDCDHHRQQRWYNQLPAFLLVQMATLVLFSWKAQPALVLLSPLYLLCFLYAQAWLLVKLPY